ncbi:hypothetical protein BC835DRAFT_1415749 [Cytidiella melzeri]|nr:hypothetical protein BC835DRAFT_1415749 [Cytidiella melzeri]
MSRTAQIDCPPDKVVVPFELYSINRRQFGQKMKLPALFSVRGERGASLGRTSANELDDKDASMFEGCGTKVSYVIKIHGYQAFKIQKYAYTRRHGKKKSCDRAKVLKQVAEVMEAFIDFNKHQQRTGSESVQFGDGGIQLQDLYLLELRHVSQSSFQPIFAIALSPAPMTLLPAPVHPQPDWCEVEELLYDWRAITSTGGHSDIWPNRGYQL